MATLTVVKPFTLQLDPPVVGEQADPKDPEKKIPIYGQSEKLRFLPGIYQDVPDDVANHWYVQAHLEGYEPPAPAPGTHQFAQEALLAAQGVRMMQPVHQQGQQPAPLGPDVRVMQRSGEVSPDAHYFAGEPQEDKELPGTVDNSARPRGEARTEGGETSFLGAKPPEPPQHRGGRHRR